MVNRDWAEAVSSGVGREILHHRKRLGLSRQALADRCGHLGYRVPPRTIENLERGRRDDVGVLELCVLGGALLVPPALLVFAAGRPADVEPLPRRQTSSWIAYEWFVGMEPTPPHRDQMNASERTAWDDGAAGLVYAEAEDYLIRQWTQTRDSLARLWDVVAESATDSTIGLYMAGLQAKGATLADIEHEIRQLRLDAADAGVRRRPLPRGIEHIDPDEGA